MKTALQLCGVRVRLGGTEVLRGVDLAVAAGEWLNVIGPNGAGKTTLLRACFGAVGHDGSIVIDGVTGGSPADRARSLGYVAQTPVIPPGMLVGDYVLLGRTPHRGMFSADRREDRIVATDVLDRLDLLGFADREVSTLSGGERQRVVLARALAQTTPILLLDEPTTALDLGHQQDVLDLVQELRVEHGLTVVATLHDLTLAARYGDRVAVMAGGEVVLTGTPAEAVTAENVAKWFGARVRILDDADGPVVVPISSGAVPQ